MKNIFWERLQLVIFDVDGTLYNQSKLRKIMLYKLLTHYFLQPWKYKELQILYHFRREREKRAGLKAPGLNEQQYEWAAEKSGQHIEKVKQTIDYWIFTAPNIYLKRCMYPGLTDFLRALENSGIKIAIYSDYNSVDKLKEMQIQTELIVSSTDKNVNSFKPSPDGLIAALSVSGITNKDNCLFIGDRFELDGLCAERADIPFLLVETTNPEFYIKLSNDLLISRNKLTHS